MGNASYQESAVKTENKDYEGCHDRILNKEVLRALIINLQKYKAACVELDKIKKHVFYGKKVELKECPYDDLVVGKEELASATVNMDLRTLRLTHASLGLMTEACETVSLILDKYLNPDATLYSPEQYAKEIGDILWYAALGADALGVQLTDIQHQNIVRLQQRYPGLFDEKKDK